MKDAIAFTYEDSLKSGIELSANRVDRAAAKMVEADKEAFEKVDGEDGEDFPEMMNQFCNSDIPKTEFWCRR